MIPELVPEGGFANPLRASVTSMAINTTLVPSRDEPKMWTDAQPKILGNIASDDLAAPMGGSLMAAVEKAYVPNSSPAGAGEHLL